MPCKKELIPKQHQAFFGSPTVTTSEGKKDDIDSNSDFDSEDKFTLLKHAYISG